MSGWDKTLSIGENIDCDMYIRRLKWGDVRCLNCSTGKPTNVVHEPSRAGPNNVMTCSSLTCLTLSRALSFTNRVF